jgi:hypothetical protein
LVLAMGALFAVSRPTAADVWDVQADNDQTTGSDNELIHGTVQIHDLATLPGPVADEDFFRFGQQGRSSYEGIVEGTSGDIGTIVVFDRVDFALTILQSAGTPPGGAGFTQSLRWINSSALNNAGEFFHVVSGACTTTCGADDQYTMRFFETTYAIARFNNSASQVTVLQIQNPTTVSVTVEIHFWSTAGAFLGTSTTTVGPHALLVLNTSTLGFAAGQSGSITVANNAHYGDLTGKAIAIEPATGFTFDTAMVARPN